MSASSNKRAIIGLVLVLIGLFFLLDNLGYGIELPWWIFTWPSIFIGIALVNVFSGNYRVAFVFLAIGGFFYLQYFDLLDIETFWPVLLIIIGVSYLLRNKEKRQAKLNSQESDETYFDEISIFGGTEKRLVSNQLQGGKITNIFGGSEIDLRDAKAVDGAVIEVFTMFGGCEIIVPANWKVNVDTIAIFGGFSDSRKNIDPDHVATVKIKGFTMFGGGEIKS